jgi:hypothetical protein
VSALRISGAILAALVALPLASCQSDDGVSSSCGGVPDHDELVAHARSLPALKKELEHDVLSPVRVAHVTDRRDGKRFVDLLDRKAQVVLQVEVSRMSNSTWTATHRTQCNQ